MAEAGGPSLPNPKRARIRGDEPIRTPFKPLAGQTPARLAMRLYTSLFAIALASVPGSPAAAATVRIAIAHNPAAAATARFEFESVPPPSRTDAGSQATLTIAGGRRDPNGAGLDALRDGRLPEDEDQPDANFFFAAGSPGGRLLVDLGSARAIRRVNTYSWHPTTRGPQVYTLYAADGGGAGFEPRPAQGSAPESRGWTLLAHVDTRPAEGRGGGQYGVTVFADEGAIGQYRHLLFDIARTETDDPFGNTFYSEIDIDDGAEYAAPPAPAAEPARLELTAGDGASEITIDTSETPDLTEWTRAGLAPVLQEWYPRIVDMLPSEGYEAPRRVSISFSADMSGVAATGGTRVRCAAQWFRDNRDGEAKGAVVHELVHVVQQYGRARGGNPSPAPTPGWVVEGIADYIRWFLYEPESRGAEITGRSLAHARHDASYRITANFLNWVTATHAPEIIRHLNAAAREGRYSDELWQQHTGHTLAELETAWRESLAQQLAAEAPNP